MNGGVLGKILSKLGADYGDDAARQIIGQYGDDITKRGANSFLSRAVDGAELPPTMLAYHGIPAHKLEAVAKMDDYLVNPSIQSVNPSVNPGGDFGEIILLANKKMVSPTSRGVHTFNRDVYSPRFPELTDDGMIAGTKKWASADNVSQYMNKQKVVGGEGGYFANTPAVVAAKNAKKFKSIRDMVENQGTIQPYADTHKAIGQFSDDTAAAIGRLEKQYPGTDYSWQYAKDDAENIMAGKAAEVAHDPADVSNLLDIVKRSKTLPTDYFETKNTNPVKLSEFSGAIIPHNLDNKKVLEMLQRNNVPIVRKYDMGAYDPLDKSGNQNIDLKNILIDLAKENRFTTPYLLGGAGALPILGGLLGSSNQENV